MNELIQNVMHSKFHSNFHPTQVHLGALLANMLTLLICFPMLGRRTMGSIRSDVYCNLVWIITVVPTTCVCLWNQSGLTCAIFCPRELPDSLPANALPYYISNRHLCLGSRGWSAPPDHCSTFRSLVPDSIGWRSSGAACEMEM